MSSARENIGRREFIRRCAMASAGMAAFMGSGVNLSAAGSRKPNILFILSDDQRWDSLSCYGNTNLTTANIDRIASEGARLDAFYPAMPLCAPSRASFLTGLYPHQNGVENNNEKDLPKGMPTVAMHLNEAGYVTGLIGKSHIGASNKGTVRLGPANPGKWGFAEAPVYLPLGGCDPLDQDLVVNGAVKKCQGYVNDVFTDAAVEFIEKHKSESWFLWFAPTAPHTPCYGGKYDQEFAEKKLARSPGWPPNESRGGPSRGTYASIRLMDDEVGRLLKKLDDLKLTQNTVVMFISDNGFMFGSHNHLEKRIYWDEAARTCAVVRWPGMIKPGTVVTTPLSSVDLLPTCMEICNAANPSGLEAVSMVPALTGGKSPRKHCFAECTSNGNWKLVRDERWKYVKLSEGKIPEYLFDVKNDPYEQNNLANSGKGEAATALADLRGALEKWLKDAPPVKGA